MKDYSPEAPFRGLTLLSKREIDAMRPACKLSSELLDYLAPMVKPGVSTFELDQAAEKWTKAHGAISAPLGYPGPKGAIDFPKSICTSINEVVCHGIPNKEDILQDGDIINIDVTPKLNGYHGDSSRTFLVGNVSDEARKLVAVTQKSLWLGIEAVQVGGRIGDIGAAIQEYAEGEGFSVVRDFVGHGVHRVFHAEPQVPHFGVRGKGKKIRPGMVFTIEPMLNVGGYDVELLADQWTAVTRDRSLSAQFEHTLAVTKSGVEVLTYHPAAVAA
ncbi:MAG: type I methionyl aminopeptidase [Cyanobacteria bacterium P01_D01_bin.105]